MSKNRSAMDIYTIGPVTGKPNENRAEFERVKDELLRKTNAMCVMTPFTMVDYAKIDGFIDSDDDIAWKIAMKGCLMEMLNYWDEWREKPNIGIAMLDGWEQSKGAKIEHDLAEALEIPCKPWEEWL